MLCMEAAERVKREGVGVRRREGRLMVFSVLPEELCTNRTEGDCFGRPH